MKPRMYGAPFGAGPLFVCMAVLGLLGGCQEPPATEIVSPPSVRVMEVGSAELGGLRQLPGRIEASERAELSFRVAGKLQQLLVVEGDPVEQGQELARLAQQDFNTVLADREAAFKRAAANYRRAKELIGDGHISRRDFDQIEARYKSTSTSLGQAKANLEYTILRAPFAGTVAMRFVENHEEVVLGQAVFSLRSSDSVDVKFDVPESLFILVKDEANSPGHDRIVVTARFSAAPGVEFPLEFKEMANKADLKTKTFEATYLMEPPEDFNVLPGMTASVTINMPSLRGAVFNIPERAVFGDIHMQPRVWLLDADTMTVSSRPVRVGRLTGDSIEVLEGLEPGDVLVTSPTNFLLEGQQVQFAPDALVEPVTPESI